VPRAADQSVGAAAGRCNVPANCRDVCGYKCGYKVGPALVAATLVAPMKAATGDDYTHPGEGVSSRMDRSFFSINVAQAIPGACAPTIQLGAH